MDVLKRKHRRLVRKARMSIVNALFRVVAAGFVCITPTVLFLGLWHGLKRMQNGELVERVAGRQGATVEDLSPGSHPNRGHELDSAERRALERTTDDRERD